MRIMVIAALASMFLACGETQSDRPGDIEESVSETKEEVVGTADPPPHETVPAPPETTTTVDSADLEECRKAADITREYYTAISRKSYPRAYALLDKAARPSSLDAFRISVADIERAEVTLGRQGRIAESDGQVTLRIPITIDVTIEGGPSLVRHEYCVLAKREGVWQIIEILRR